MATNYGYFWEGSANVIFVVTHGAQKNEQIIAEQVRNLDDTEATLIVNEKIVRRRVDLNNVQSWKNKKQTSTRRFIRSIENSVCRLLAAHRRRPIYVFFCHNAEAGLKKSSLLFPRIRLTTGARELIYSPTIAGAPRPYDLDIGIGATGLVSFPPEVNAAEARAREAEFHQELKPAAEIYPRRGAGGLITCPAASALALIVAAKEIVPSWRVEIGREFAAQHQKNLSQFVYRKFQKTGRVFTAQFEFLHSLPPEEIGRYLRRVIALVNDF